MVYAGQSLLEMGQFEMVGSDGNPNAGLAQNLTSMGVGIDCDLSGASSLAANFFNSATGRTAGEDIAPQAPALENEQTLNQNVNQTMKPGGSSF